jgi:hypothetical protein
MKEKELMVEDKSPRSLPILQEIRTSADYAAGMSALMGDLISGRVTPQVGNAVCNAGGKLLKIKEMEMRFGTDGPGGADRSLVLVDPKRVTPKAGRELTATRG